jgi:hypothetical protein
MIISYLTDKFLSISVLVLNLLYTAVNIVVKWLGLLLIFVKLWGQSQLFWQEFLMVFLSLTMQMLG